MGVVVVFGLDEEDVGLRVPRRRIHLLAQLLVAGPRLRRAGEVHGGAKAEVTLGREQGLDASEGAADHRHLLGIHVGERLEIGRRVRHVLDLRVEHRYELGALRFGGDTMNLIHDVFAGRLPVAESMRYEEDVAAPDEEERLSELLPGSCSLP